MASTSERSALRFTEEEAIVVDCAKKMHRDTTSSAERALQTVERTRELAGNTVDTLHSQGNKLEQVDQDLHEIDAGVRESKSMLKYMRRCCLCFLCACCCDCDPDAENDKTRKRRMATREQARKGRRDFSERSDMRRADIPADARGPVDESKARLELFGRPTRNAASSSNRTPAIGEGLTEEDQQEILQQTKKQERVLNKIDSALDDLKRMGTDMSEELARQEPVLARVNEHADKTHADITLMTKGARKDFKLKGRG